MNPEKKEVAEKIRQSVENLKKVCEEAIAMNLFVSIGVSNGRRDYDGYTSLSDQVSTRVDISETITY